MAIVTRLGKGSKLTIEEMDNNLLSLETDISSNVSAITSKLDKGSYTGSAKDLDNAIAANVTLIASKLDKGAYTGTAKDLETLIIAASTVASGVSITPTSPAPSGTGIASFTATQAGTYTNYGGVIVAANSFAIISRSATGVFSISQTAFDFTDYAKLIDQTPISKYKLEILGDYFYKIGLFFNKTSGLYLTSNSYKVTDYIEFIQGDVLIATGTEKSTSLNNITFLTSSKTIISGIDLQSNEPTLIVNSANTPSNTAFVVLNSAINNVTKLNINGLNSFSEKIQINSNDISQNKVNFELQENKLNENLIKIFGDYFIKTGFFFNKTTGAYVALANAKSTGYINFIQGETLFATGTLKSTSFSNITFLTSSKTIISSIDLPSNQPTLSVNSTNTPSNTAFVVLNANISDVTKLNINDNNALTEAIETNVNAIGLVSSDSLFYKQRISGYFTEAGYRSLTGVFVPFSSLRSTKLIPFVVGNNLVAVNTAKGGSYANINFYNSSGAHISFISNNSNILTLIVNSANTPINTAFITLNEGLSKPVELRINYLTDLNNVSKVLVGHQWNNRKWTSFGDSITAAGSYQSYIVREIACLSTVRGVGSSSVTADFTGVAIQPNGEYIDRLSNYSSDLDFTNALSAAGFTNEVTTPTWLNYSVNPSGFTLPANSYFKISAQASGQERINTLPIDSEAVTVMFGTNDEKNDAYIGNINDYGDGAGGLTKNFIGSYRLMLKRIKTRCPNAKIIIIIPPKKTSEYNFTNNLRTAEGISFDNFRDAIRLICSTYGHEVIDTTKELNFTNIQTLLTDGTHPTQSGYKAMGELISRKFSDINLSLLT
jgi:hypothetical protein